MNRNIGYVVQAENRNALSGHRFDVIEIRVSHVFQNKRRAIGPLS
jgi:hypothetical protein